MGKKTEMTAVLKPLKEILKVDLEEATWNSGQVYSSYMSKYAGKRYAIRSIPKDKTVTRERYDYLMVIKEGSYDGISFYVKKEWIKDIEKDYTDEEWFAFAEARQTVWTWNENNNNRYICILKKYKPEEIRRFISYYCEDDAEREGGIPYLYAEPYFPKNSNLS